MWNFFKKKNNNKNTNEDEDDYRKKIAEIKIAEIYQTSKKKLNDLYKYVKYDKTINDIYINYKNVIDAIIKIDKYNYAKKLEQYNNYYINPLMPMLEQLKIKNDLFNDKINTQITIKINEISKLKKKINSDKNFNDFAIPYMEFLILNTIKPKYYSYPINFNTLIDFAYHFDFKIPEHENIVENESIFFYPEEFIQLLKNNSYTYKVINIFNFTNGDSRNINIHILYKIGDKFVLIDTYFNTVKILSDEIAEKINKLTFNNIIKFKNDILNLQKEVDELYKKQKSKFDVDDISTIKKTLELMENDKILEFEDDELINAIEELKIINEIDKLKLP